LNDINPDLKEQW